MTPRSLAVAGLILGLLGGSLAQPATAQNQGQNQGQNQNQNQTQPPAQAAPQEQAPPAKVFGEWTQRCTPTPPPGASPPKDGELQVCFVVHQYVDPQSQRPVLKMTVGFFEPDRRPGAVIALPLGVPLARGAQLAVDGQPVASVPFEVCRRDGCQAFLPLSEKIVASFKAGSGGQVKVESSQGQTLELPFSLQGFTAGYESIQ